MPPPDSDLNTYLGLHARYYDVIYADKPYGEEAEFVTEQLRSDLPGAPNLSLLDLACGTGRHALAFAAQGYSVTGVDYSEELLGHAREAAADRAVEVTFVAQDIRTLDLGASRFETITCLFDSIGYLLTNDAIVQALGRVRGHLASGGVLVAEFLHAPAMLLHASPVRVGRWDTPEGGKLLRISESRLDIARQILNVAYELYEFPPDETNYLRSTETQQNRFFSLEEMRALMTAAGFSVERFVPAYQRDAEISDETWHVLAVARPLA